MKNEVFRVLTGNSTYDWICPDYLFRFLRISLWNWKLLISCLSSMQCLKTCHTRSYNISTMIQVFSSSFIWLLTTHSNALVSFDIKLLPYAVRIPDVHKKYCINGLYSNSNLCANEEKQDTHWQKCVCARSYSIPLGLESVEWAEPTCTGWKF